MTTTLSTAATAAFDSSRLAAMLLVTVRVSGLLLMSSALAAAVPMMIRLLLCLALSCCIALGLEAASLPRLDDTWALFQALLSEFGLGAMLGLGVNMAFAAFALGGRLLDVQIGFGMGQVLDPVSRHQVPFLTGALNQLALVCFFSSGAFAGFLRGLQLSFERFPPGAPWPLESALVMLMKQGGGMFSLGFALVAPVVFCLMLVEFALGVLARNVPQMNMFAMGLPLKIVTGLVALSLWLSGAGAVLGRIYASIFSAWNGVLR